MKSSEKYSCFMRYCQGVLCVHERRCSKETYTKGGVNMAVTRIPVEGRLQFMYNDNMATLRFSGINPQINATSLNMVATQLRTLQTVSADHAFLTVEHELQAV